MKEKYCEIIVLNKLLDDHGISHIMYNLMDGYQIVIPCPEEDGNKSALYSIVEHQCSYGHEYDLLEMWRKGHGVTGFLKADDVLQIIQGIHENQIEKSAVENTESSRGIWDI